MVDNMLNFFFLRLISLLLFGQFLDSFILRLARSGGGVPPTSVLLKVQALRSLNEPQSHLRWF